MLRALTAAGIRPDLVVGSSAGALNAAGFAADPTPDGIERLARAWSATRRSDVFPLRPVALAQGVLGLRDHLVPPRYFERWLSAHIGIDALEDAVVPVHVVTTDRETGAPVVLSSGPTIPALLASTAIPGVFPSVVVEGRALIDGGLAADTPVRQAVSRGATRIFVLPSHAVGAEPHRDRGALSLLAYGYTQVFGHWTTDQVAAVDGVDVAILPVPRLGRTHPLDFSYTAALIESADLMARQWLTERDEATGNDLHHLGGAPVLGALPRHMDRRATHGGTPLLLDGRWPAGNRPSTTTAPRSVPARAGV
jgi:NTE family protein